MITNELSTWPMYSTIGQTCPIYYGLIPKDLSTKHGTEIF